jgi:hypothetical protein
VRQAHEREQTKTRDPNGSGDLQHQNRSRNENSGPGAEQMAEHFSMIMHAMRKHGINLESFVGRFHWKCNAPLRPDYKLKEKVAPNMK